MTPIRTRAVALAAATFAVVLVVGCSLTTDVSGLSGPATVVSPDAAATADGTASTPETGADGATVDATTRFCVPGMHAFCDDFDVGPPLATWSEQQIDAKGSLSVSTLRAKSAPGSLLATMARRASTDPHAQSTARKSFPGVRRVVLELDVFLETPAFVDGDINSGIVVIYFSSSTSGNASMALSAGKEYTTLGNPGTSVGGDPLTPDTWLHARFDFDPGGTVSGSIGASSWKQTFPAYVVGSSPETTVELGVNGYNEPAPEFRVFYDNVTIDFP